MKLAYGLGLCVMGLLGLHVVNGQTFVQPFHSGLTQNATVLCFKNGTDYCMKFTLTKNSDTVQHVFTRNGVDPTMNSAYTLPVPAPSDTETVLEFCWTINPVFLGDADTAKFLPYQTAAELVSIDAIAKSHWDITVNDTITFPDDVLYTATCNITEMVDAVLVSGSLLVNGSIAEMPVKVTPIGKLEVIDPGTNVAAATVNLGDDIYLKASVVPSANPSSDPTGLYVYDCWVCDSALCDGIKVLVEKSDGCPNLPQVGTFQVVPSQFSIITASLIFPAFQLNQAPNAPMWFTCSASFCFDAADAKCVEYCIFTGGKRKRRAAGDRADSDEDVQSIVAELVVRTPDNLQGRRIETVNGVKTLVDDQESTAVQEPTTIGLIAAVITLAGLLLIGVIIAVAVFFRFSGRTPVSEKA